VLAIFLLLCPCFGLPYADGQVFFFRTYGTANYFGFLFESRRERREKAKKNSSSLPKKSITQLVPRLNIGRVKFSLFFPLTILGQRGERVRKKKSS